MKIAQSALAWILAPFLAGVFFVILSIFFSGQVRSVFLFISLILFLITIVFLLFFRDPERKIGVGVVAPADGRIQGISRLDDDVVGKCVRVSTFMNLYNVHVNRMPLDGVVKDVVHLPGSYLPAFKKESEKNERLVLTMDTQIGVVKLVQIAGTLARRIIPYVKKGDNVKKGCRIGIIRFGSRVDIYLPSAGIKKLNVKMGDMVKAGEYTVAEVND